MMVDRIKNEQVDNVQSNGKEMKMDDDDENTNDNNDDDDDDDDEDEMDIYDAILFKGERSKSLPSIRSKSYLANILENDILQSTIVNDGKFFCIVVENILLYIYLYANISCLPLPLLLFQCFHVVVVVVAADV